MILADKIIRLRKKKMAGLRKNWLQNECVLSGGIQMGGCTDYTGFRKILQL